MGWENILKSKTISKNPPLVKLIDEIMTNEPRTSREILQDVKSKYKYAPSAMQLSKYLKSKYPNKFDKYGIYLLFWKG